MNILWRVLLEFSLGKLAFEVYRCTVITVDAYKASIAIRIKSDIRDEEQEQRWRERQDRGVLQDTQDLTVTCNIYVGKQGERGEAKISHRQTRLNAVDER